MTPTSKDLEWSRAYAQQALSDLRAMNTMREASMDKCHRLHYLQMAAEKVCKAYLTLSNGHEQVRKVHGYTSRTLPIIAKNIFAAEQQRHAQSHWQMDAVRHFAREIEVLAPASHDEFTRQDNSEYPWENAAGYVLVPCRYNFPKIDENARTVIRIVRILQTAAERYASDTPLGHL